MATVLPIIINDKQ